MKLDDDVVQALTRLRQERGIGTSEALNELVRRGLAAPAADERPFVQRTSSMGRARIPLDNIAEALDFLEGEARR